MSAHFLLPFLTSFSSARSAQSLNMPLSEVSISITSWMEIQLYLRTLPLSFGAWLRTQAFLHTLPVPLPSWACHRDAATSFSRLFFHPQTTLALLLFWGAWDYLPAHLYSAVRFIPEPPPLQCLTHGVVPFHWNAFLALLLIPDLIWKSFITCLISFFFFLPLTLFCYHYADFVTLLFKYEEHFR